MANRKTEIEPKAPVTNADTLSDLELDQVTGGITVRKAGEHPQEAIGSQSSGAGAGKVTFNPF